MFQSIDAWVFPEITCTGLMSGAPVTQGGAFRTGALDDACAENWTKAGQRRIVSFFVIGQATQAHQQSAPYPLPRSPAAGFLFSEPERPYQMSKAEISGRGPYGDKGQKAKKLQQAAGIGLWFSLLKRENVGDHNSRAEGDLLSC